MAAQLTAGTTLSTDAAVESGVLNAFTVDVEDYYHVSAFERDIDRRDWDRFDSRVEASTQSMLEILAEAGVRGTFFVLGWVARRFPKLVRAIHDAGHELGSHSYWHRLVYELSPEEFRSDLRDSRSILEDAVGGPITAYRAPSFSITRQSQWALEILAEEGFTVDSSIFPIVHDRYGIPDAHPYLHEIVTPSGSLHEFPPSVVRFAHMNFPVSGGGYFRLYPLSWTIRGLARINHIGRPFMFYIHPWELDPSQPRLAVGSRLSRARHRVNLASTAGKLRRLLHRFRFGRMDEVIQAPTTGNHTAGANQRHLKKATPRCENAFVV